MRKSALLAATLLSLLVLYPQSFWSQARDGRTASLAVVDQCLAALRKGDQNAAIATFAQAEKQSPVTRKQLSDFAQASAIKTNSGVDAGSTGNSAAEFEGHSLTYLFGETHTAGKETHFTADAVKENGTWKLTRLFVDGAGTAGSDRFTYDKVPKVNNAVQSMISGESVLNIFMRAAERGDLDAALGCWVESERERQGKKDEVSRLIAAKPHYFRNFQQVDEGHSNFGFKGSGDGVQIVTVNGTMSFAGGVQRSFTATLRRENENFKINSLRF